MNSWFLEQARKGNVYHADTATGKEVTTIHATHTGLTIENPYGSGKDLVMESVSFASSTLAAIAELGLGVGPNESTVVSATTTAAVIHNARLSGGDFGLGVAKAYEVATLSSTPVWFEAMGSVRITGAVEGARELTKHLDGTVIVAPGMYICLMALTTARTGLCSATWAEVDVLTEQEIALL